MAQNSDAVLQNSNGGKFRSYHAAGATGAAAALTGKGRLCKVTVVAVGSATTTIYDAASATGDILLLIPASPTAGTIYDLQVPVTTGIYVGGATNTSGVSVSYNKDGANGEAA